MSQDDGRPISSGWTVDIDEEFGGDLLRWNDDIIAQVTGEDDVECRKAYADLVALVGRSQRDVSADQPNTGDLISDDYRRGFAFGLRAGARARQLTEQLDVSGAAGGDQ